LSSRRIPDLRLEPAQQTTRVAEMVRWGSRLRPRELRDRSTLRQDFCVSGIGSIGP
jgi:hypothetical protein